MPRFTHLALAVAAVTSAAGSLALLVLVPSACTSSAPAPAPRRNVITIPGPDQISNTLETSRCPWLLACIAALAGGTTSLKGANGHQVEPGTASGPALLPMAPLIADEHATAGN